MLFLCVIAYYLAEVFGSLLEERFPECGICDLTRLGCEAASGASRPHKGGGDARLRDPMVAKMLHDDPNSRNRWARELVEGRGAPDAANKIDAAYQCAKIAAKGAVASVR